MKILLIEDDDRLSQALGAFLTRLGYEIERAADGSSALEMLDPDIEVILLDLGLPDVDGIQLCQRIRSQTGVPIIIATARSDVQERIRGLRAGADDFVVKPYDVGELVARIEAVTRRHRSSSIDFQSHLDIDVFGVRIDFVERQVLVDLVPVQLTKKEFEIIAVLARYPGVVVPRERLIREVWNTEWNAFRRSLEVHIGSIRRKIDREALIETVRGVGYRLVVG